MQKQVYMNHFITCCSRNKVSNKNWFTIHCTWYTSSWSYVGHAWDVVYFWRERTTCVLGRSPNPIVLKIKYVQTKPTESIHSRKDTYVIIPTTYFGGSDASGQILKVFGADFINCHLIKSHLNTCFARCWTSYPVSISMNFHNWSANQPNSYYCDVTTSYK